MIFRLAQESVYRRGKEAKLAAMKKSSVNYGKDAGEEKVNPAAEIFAGGMAISLQLSRVDGVRLGHGDAVGIIYAASIVVTAAVVWAGPVKRSLLSFGSYRVYKTLEESFSTPPLPIHGNETIITPRK